MSKKIVITFNIVVDRVAHIAAKARTGLIAQRATAAGTYGHGDGLFDAKVTRILRAGVIVLSKSPRAF
jgi:hypothetical protein